MKIEFDNRLFPENFTKLEDNFSSVEFIESKLDFKEVVIDSEDYIWDNFLKWLEEQIITNWYVFSYNKNKDRFYLT